MKLKTTITALALSSTLLATLAPAMNAKAVTDSELEQAKSQKSSATDEISRLQEQVNKIQADRKQATDKKAKLETEAKQLDSETQTLNENIKSRTKNLEAQARSAQVNTSTSPVMDTIFNSKSLTDVIQKVSAIATVTSANSEMLKSQKEDMASLKAKSKELQTNYSNYLEIEKGLAKSEHEADAAKAKLEVATLDYEATIATGEKERADLLAQKAAAQTKLKTAEAATQKVVAQQEESKEAYDNAPAVDSISPSAPIQQAQSQSTQSNTTAPTQPSTPSAPSTTQPTTPTQPSKPSQPTQTGSVWDYRGSFMTSNSAYNGYAGGGCTDYVWQWFAQRGVYIPNVMPGNGKDWAYQMPRAPKVVPGVIASFAPGAHGSSSVYGHVAIVQSVNADGSFVVSEGGTGIWGNVRTIPNQSGVTFVLP